MSPQQEDTPAGGLAWQVASTPSQDVCRRMAENDHPHQGYRPSPQGSRSSNARGPFTGKIQPRWPTLSGLHCASAQGPSPPPTSQPGKVLPRQSSQRGSERVSKSLSVAQRSPETDTFELGPPGQPQKHPGYFSVSIHPPPPQTLSTTPEKQHQCSWCV